MFPVCASTVPKSPKVAWTSSKFWTIEALMVDALMVDEFWALVLNTVDSPIEQSKLVVVMSSDVMDSKVESTQLKKETFR